MALAFAVLFFALQIGSSGHRADPDSSYHQDCAICVVAQMEMGEHIITPNFEAGLQLTIYVDPVQYTPAILFKEYQTPPGRAPPPRSPPLIFI